MEIKDPHTFSETEEDYKNFFALQKNKKSQIGTCNYLNRSTWRILFTGVIEKNFEFFHYFRLRKQDRTANSFIVDVITINPAVIKKVP